MKYSWYLFFLGTKELYELGQIAPTQLREAQLNLFAVKTKINVSKYDIKIYEYQVLKISGQVADQ